MHADVEAAFLGAVTVIDVRPREEYLAGHIPGAISLPVAELKKRVPTLSKRRDIVAYCVKGAEVGIWHALYAPKGTPKAAVDKLVSSMQEALKDQGVQKKFADLGAVTYGADKQTPQALQAHLKAEIDKWGPLIKKAGQYAD